MAPSFAVRTSRESPALAPSGAHRPRWARPIRLGVDWPLFLRDTFRRPLASGAPSPARSRRTGRSCEGGRSGEAALFIQWSLTEADRGHLLGVSVQKSR